VIQAAGQQDLLHQSVQLGDIGVDRGAQKRVRRGGEHLHSQAQAGQR
jgi:hypothetical protein